MPNKLPDDWLSGKKKSLNVALELGIRNCPVTNLYIYKGNPKQGKLLLCRWLPYEEEDLRPESKKRYKNGKRRSFEGRTGCVDPFDAGKEAIKWYREIRNQMIEDAKLLDFDTGKSLEHYFEIWFDSFKSDYINQRGGQKRITNVKGYWSGKEIGICHQPFAQKNIEKITYKDLDDYWKVIDKKGKRIGSKMAETKKQIKTLINKLFATAKLSGDFSSNLRNPEYPPIKEGEKKQAIYLQKKDWEKLLYQIIELSTYKADRSIDLEAFMNIEWTNRDRKNPRNFVELYDACMVMWFFYLRAEDLPPLRTEWFSIRKDENGEEEAVLNLERSKGHKNLIESVAYRPDAVDVMKKILKRRKENGYLLFDFYNRPEDNPSQSQVGETLNKLLQFACEKAWIKNKVTFTSIRHTAFMQTCEEFDDLRDETNLVTFARNAYTSAEMLRDTYLKKVRGTELAKKARKTIKKGKITGGKSMIERARDNYKEIKAGKKVTDKEFEQIDIAEKKPY